ncbi:type II toxin-antitoxin system death-on-curing family toxin [Marinilactibacillus psychrotolerans]|uniref:type II toxin-antitoxin system death-on-curing family toxin n=1 Tax=Marinilactibacillus psychrotolerans TaxID=191770 RepID=UPI0039AFCC36
MNFLTENNLITINAYLIQRYSPGEDVGVKVPEALDMTVNSVHTSLFGEEMYPTLFDKSAVLFINLIKKHCFYNANKRTAYHALATFLQMNNYEILLEADDAVEFCVMVATWDDEFDILKKKVRNTIKDNSKALDV